MTELALPLRGAHFASRFTDRGVSDDARRLSDRMREVVDELLESFTLGRGYRQVVDELREAVLEADEDFVGPDERTIAFALRFLEAFPTYLAVPEVGVDVDGDIFFEWIMGPRRRFNVAIQGSGTVTYAGIVGPARFYGREVFDDEIPSAVVAGFHRTLEAATTTA